MESGCSLAELIDMSLVQEGYNRSTTDAVRRCKRKGNTLIGECQIIVLFFLLITESESWEDFSKWNGMLAVSVLYVIYI
jgi:hypothetical protein